MHAIASEVFDAKNNCLFKCKLNKHFFKYYNLAKRYWKLYVIFVIIGYEREAKQFCPEPLLGIFNYTETVMNVCDNDTELDVCSDRMTMMYNYTLCNTTQAHTCRFTMHIRCNAINSASFFKHMLIYSLLPF